MTFNTEYQPSAAGGTRSPPATPATLHRLLCPKKFMCDKIEGDNCYQYQPSGAGGTRSPPATPAKSKMAPRGPQNG